jgi:chromosome transmission fidelity protein 8
MTMADESQSHGIQPTPESNIALSANFGTDYKPNHSTNMTAVTLHPPSRASQTRACPNLPALLHTPAGLAILELQGTINVPTTTDEGSPSSRHAIGRIEFPEYRADAPASDTAWMRRVYMFVGQHQRLAGEVKKLPRALAVVRRRQVDSAADVTMDSGDADGGHDGKELEIVEIVRHKLVFSQRPEPVGSS